MEPVRTNPGAPAAASFTRQEVLRHSIGQNLDTA
jgi:hypothetical protein